MLSRKASSKFLISDMDLHIQRMRKLIEEDADSFAKKADNYYRKRPELIALVEEFQRMYRTLADRCDAGDIRRVPSDLHSRASSCVSEIGSELPSRMPSPDRRRMSGGPRAAGFDVFLNGGGYYCWNREGDGSSALDYESGLDEESPGLHNRIIKQEEGNHEDDFDKIVRYEDELGNGNVRYKFYGEEANPNLIMLKNSSSMNANAGLKSMVQESFEDLEDEIVDPLIKICDESPCMQENKLSELEKEVASLRKALTSQEFCTEDLHDQLKASKKEVSFWKNEFKKEKEEVSRLHDWILQREESILNRDQEIMRMKEALSNVNGSLASENGEIACKREFTIELIKSFVMLQLEHDVMVVEKDELIAYIDELAREVSFKDDQIDLVNQYLHQLQGEHINLIIAAKDACRSTDDLQSRVRELEREIARKQTIITKEVDEKCEAIRHLCVSLEHYRIGYHRLKQAFMENNKMPVMASK